MKEVLLLSDSYIPISVISWRRAAKLVLGRDKAEVLKEYDRGHFYFKPAVLRLKVKTPNPYKIRKIAPFSRKNIFIRDSWRCQYCGIYLTKKNATIDHVMPKSRGGKNSYNNCVASCQSCNIKKGNGTPEEAGMNTNLNLGFPAASDFLGRKDAPNEWHFFIGL